MNQRSRRLAGWVPSLHPLEDRALLSPLAGPMVVAPSLSRATTVMVSGWQPRNGGPGDVGGFTPDAWGSRGGPSNADPFNGGRFQHPDFSPIGRMPLSIVSHNDPHTDPNPSDASPTASANGVVTPSNAGSAGAVQASGIANAGPADASPSDHGAPVNIPVFRFLAPAMVAHSTPDTPVAATPSADASLQNQPITVILVPGVANLANAEGAASASNDATATADLPAIAQSTTGSLAAVTRPFSALSEDSLTPPAPLNLPDPTPTTPADTKVDPVASDQAEESLSSDPMGADLIAELTPLDSSSLEATLAGLIARFDGLETAIPQANADGQVRLVPVALGVAAFEVARRWWNNRSETAARRTWKSRSTLLRGFF